MIRLVALIAVLGLLWSPALASFQSFSIPSSDGNYIEQTVSIDNENQVANIHVYGGLCSSDTIFDYKHGYIATRLFSRRACFILKMQPGYVMQLEDVGRLAYEKQMMREMVSPMNVWVQYEPSNSFFGDIKEWLEFGSSIENLCKHVPVYKVEKIDRRIGGSSCVKAGILGIMGISVCGKISL